jgi:hypothetical protein
VTSDIVLYDCAHFVNESIERLHLPRLTLEGCLFAARHHDIAQALFVIRQLSMQCVEDPICACLYSLVHDLEPQSDSVGQAGVILI